MGGAKHAALEAELARQLEAEHQEAEALRSERDRNMTQKELDNERRQQLALSLAAEEQRRQDTEDKLVALQNTHATTEEEAAKHLVLEQQLVMNLNLARTEIDGLQSQLQRELDAERAHSKANDEAYAENLQNQENKHLQAMTIVIQQTRDDALKGMVRQESVAKLVAKNDQALAEAAKERAKLAQENERQHKTMAEQLQEHMKENAVLSATAAAELAKLRQETNKNTTKYKAEEARLLADLEEMKRAESALRDSYKKQLEKEQKMHQKTKEERKKLNETLAQELKKEKKLKIDLANELEKGSQLKTALATVQNDLSTTEAERNKKIEELVQTKQKHEAVTFALMADVAAATNERKETERRLNAELDAQKAANIEIHQEAQRKQAVLDKMIDSEKQRAIEHAKTMAQLDTLEGYSKEEKSTLLAAARKDLDTSNQALHNLEQKLLNELAKERAAANKNKAESNTVKKQRDATEKARRQIAGQFDEASRQNNDLAMQLEKMANDKKKVLADLLVEKEKEKKLIDDLKK